MQHLKTLKDKGDLPKVVSKNLDNFITCHCSSGFKHSLNEILENKAVQQKISESNVSNELGALEKFFEMLSNDTDRVCYGPMAVKYALGENAIETMLVSDKLFRAKVAGTRTSYVRLVEDAKKSGAEVFHFSSMHPSGERLNNLTGIAAILRFPMPELDELDEDDN